MDLILHIVSLATVAALSAGSAWVLLRTDTSADEDPMCVQNPGPDSDVGSLCAYSIWFQRLRWFAIVGGVAATVVAVHALDLLTPSACVPTISLFGGLAGFNLFLHYQTEKSVHHHRLLVLQMGIDLVVLTAALLLTGGLGNPFYSVLALHVILAGMLLKPPFPVRICMAGCFMVVILMCSHLFHLPPHNDLWILPHNELEELTSVFAMGIPLILILVMSTYFLSIIRTELHEANEERRKFQEQLVRQERIVLLGEVAAGVAHEINNPIHGIQSALQLLTRSKAKQSPERSEAHLQLIREGVNRIEIITRRLLQHGRIDHRTDQDVDLKEVVHSVIAFVDHRLTKQGTRLQISVSDNLPLVYANSTSLFEVFINLLINALDVTGPADTIFVEGYRRHHPSGSVIAVRDTGPGVQDEVAAKIFSPFFTTKEVGKGSGLGLSICKSIVESIGGTIEFETFPGQGTEFKVFFPDEPEQDASATRRSQTTRIRN